MKDKFTVLFLCVANSARSQLAEALARSVFKDSCTVLSAGSKPSGKVHDGALRELQRRGLETEGLYSKSVDELSQEQIESLDLIVTLCAEEVCPVILNRAERLHWPLKDPAATQSENDQAAAFAECAEILLKKIYQMKEEKSF
ncbi:MAG: arsenate reductase ArsC [Proteobacteria bacterium]|jgi:arsenate reductase|nr:arsenate reductase ArsC [Pseudomonadota bacterium]